MANRQLPELEAFLQTAVDKEASELFLIPGAPPCYRVEGSIKHGEANMLTPDAVRDIAAAAVGEDNLAKIGRQVGEIMTTCGVPGVVNGSMCIARSRGAYTIAISLHPSRLLDVDELAVPKALLEAVESSTGLFLFTGGVGSGKTNTIYSVIDHINAGKPWHICLITPPTPMHLNSKRSLVQHREISIDVPDCVAGIRSAIAQDPDLLFVSEIRNLEELKACVDFDEDGRRTFLQVNAPTPDAAIERLTNLERDDLRVMFRGRLSEIVAAICVQVLLPRASGKGRVCPYGVMIPDDEMRRAIAEGRSIASRSTPLPDNCRTLAEDILRMHKEGQIAHEVAHKALENL